MTRRRILRILVAALAVFALGALGTYIYFRSRGNQLLQAAGERWISGRLAALSDSIYEVHLHHLRYRPETRSLVFDSLTLATDVTRNQARAHPMPTLTLAVYNGRVAGIDLWEVVRGQRIHAREVGFDSVGALVVLPPIYRDSADTPADSASAAPADTTSPLEVIVVGGDEGARPGQPLALVDRVRFNHMSGRLVLPFEEGPQELELGGLSVDLDRVSFDPSRNATTPFHVADIRLEAGRFAGDLGKSDHLTFASLAGSFRDSTFRVDSIRLSPRGGDSGYVANRKYRGSRLEVGADRVAIEGMDWNGLLRSTDIAVRRIVLDGFELDLLTDKRLPPDPGPKKPRRTPHQQVAALRARLAIDSVILHHSRVQYAERAANADRPGRLRFEQIEGAVTNLSNDPRLQTDSTPMRIAAKASFMGAGRLDALIEFPLLAPSYEARYRARLGRMDATKLNEMIQPLAGAQIKEGEFTSLLLEARVHQGVYRGRLVPQYTNLGVSIPQTAKQKREEKGIGGFFKGIKRGVMTVAANTVVRTNNPSKPGKPPETGTVKYVRRPSDSFWSGIWQSLKPALKESLVNIDL